MYRYADLEGAARIARIGAHFDWTWTRTDIPRFCEITGFQEIGPNALGIGLLSNLDVSRSDVYVCTDRGTARELAEAGQEIEDISICVADLATCPPPHTNTEVAQQHSRLLERLITELGPPTRQPYPETLWEMPTVVVALLALDDTVDLGFTNPIYQQWNDTQGAGEL